MKSEKLTIKNFDGKKLAARLDLPADGQPQACAIFAHCFTCTKNFKAVSNLSRALTAQGVAVLRFDFTGLGESEGDFADTNFSSNVSDLVAVAGYLEEHYEAPALLIGHSFGGTAVLRAAAEIPSAKAVAVIAAPFSPEHVTKLFNCQLDEIEESGEAEVQLAGRPFTIRQQLIHDLRESKMEEAIRNLQRALLILHSPTDGTVGIENASQIFATARHPKSFVALDGADHLLPDEADSLFAGAMIATWMRRYVGLPLPGARSSQRHSTATNGSVPSVERNQALAQTGEGFYTQVAMKGGIYIADEPEKAGGTDQGPTPYEYLSAALGACTTITVRMYADRKGWPLENISVDVKWRSVKVDSLPAEEQVEGNSRGRVDLFEKSIRMEGPLSGEQKERMMEIAEKCPVNRTLHSHVVTRSTLED